MASGSRAHYEDVAGFLPVHVRLLHVLDPKYEVVEAIGNLLH